MNHWLKTLLLCIPLLAGAAGTAAAEEVSFRTDTELLVAKDTPFRVEFTLNAEPDAGTFVPPSFEGFDVIAGPQTAQVTSRNIINGRRSNSYNFVVTYVLVAPSEGNFTIGEATIASKGRSYRTQAVPIEVIAEKEAESPGGGESPASGQNDARQRLDKEDILLRLELSRTSAYKGEPVRATLKLYYRVNVVGLEGGKFPSFNGFWAQELDEQAQRQSHRERYNGRIYETSVLKEYLLYAQQSGELTIDPAELTAVAQIVVQNNDPNPFLGSMPEIYNVRRELRTPAIRLSVEELPAGAPASFTGAVGQFTLEATMPKTTLPANSSGSSTLRISGTGNLPFVQAPKVAFPSSFEQYTVKTTESIRTTASGLQGYRQFEYPFIARAEGEYEVPPVAFTYFDPAKKSYITLSSRRITLEITADGESPAAETPHTVAGLTKEEVRLLDEDIRFIRLGEGRLRTARPPFMLGGAYFAVMALVVLLFAGAYAALRKQIRDRQNSVLMRGRRANKVAVQRLRAAAGYMKQENARAFYEEMLHALWGYMSDKFNIPVANLTKENVREELHKRGIGPEQSQRFSDIISRCEEAQYSPAADTRMSDVYNEGVDFLSKLESVIKK